MATPTYLRMGRRRQRQPITSVLRPKIDSCPSNLPPVVVRFKKCTAVGHHRPELLAKLILESSRFGAIKKLGDLATGHCLGRCEQPGSLMHNSYTRNS